MANIRVTGRVSDTSLTESESKSETMVGGLAVAQNSNSSMSKASSLQSRHSFVAYDKILLEVPKNKRKSFFPVSTCKVLLTW